MGKNETVSFQYSIIGYELKTVDVETGSWNRLLKDRIFSGLRKRIFSGPRGGTFSLFRESIPILASFMEIIPIDPDCYDIH